MLCYASRVAGLRHDYSTVFWKYQPINIEFLHWKTRCSPLAP